MRSANMPELPEVETICQDLRSRGLAGEPIQAVSVFWHKTITPLSTEEFGARLVGKSIIGIDRRAKYIKLLLDDGQYLLVHLRMTGAFSIRGNHGNIDAHDRVVFHFDKRELVFHDTRKFGRMLLCTDPSIIFGRLGPEPFEPTLTTEAFHQRLSSHKRMLKPLLLDQSFIAGLGNIYVDESLFTAKLHPCKSAAETTLSEADSLLQAIRMVLWNAIENRGTSLGDGEGNFNSDGRYGTNASRLQVFHHTGKPCPRCSTIIERLVVGQRGTHLCPQCQRMR